jgi:CHAD domain-containing protein
MAKLLLAELDRDRAPLTEKRMHQYRLLGKRVRYLAEFAGRNAESMPFIQEMKRMQDVIGDWHDWLELTNRAEGSFGRAHDSSLVAVLQNLTRAKFRQAVRVLSEVRNVVREVPKAAEKNSQLRKTATSQTSETAAAAVA